VRYILVLLFLVLLTSPMAANAQSFALYGAAGPTLTDTGNSLAVGAGVSPASLLSFVVAFERTHLASRVTRNDNVVSSFRGGTLLLGTVELRFAPFGRDRFGPYGVAGFAAGVSHPNVNESYPDRVTNQARGVFAGGGVDVPLGERISLFGDFRMMLAAEGVEGLIGVGPLRVGIAWRF